MSCKWKRVMLLFKLYQVIIVYAILNLSHHYVNLVGFWAADKRCFLLSRWKSYVYKICSVFEIGMPYDQLAIGIKHVNLYGNLAYYIFQKLEYIPLIMPFFSLIQNMASPCRNSLIRISNIQIMHSLKSKLPSAFGNWHLIHKLIQNRHVNLDRRKNIFFLFSSLKKKVNLY